MPSSTSVLAGRAPPAGDLASVGLGSARSPAAGRRRRTGRCDGLLLTGRLSVQSQPWLADHAVLGSVLLPGTAFVELALRAGDQVGCELVEELTLAVPLVLPERGGLWFQLAVGAADESGRCSFAVYSRRGAGDTRPWTRHATGCSAVAGTTGVRPIP